MSGNMLQLHIMRDKLDIQDFKTSVDSFMTVIESLSEDAAPVARWLISVDAGSVLLSAEMYLDDKDIDPEPIFKVIEGGITSLTTGQGIESCPKKARDAYTRLAKVFDGPTGNETTAEIRAVGSHSIAPNILPIKRTRPLPNVSEPYKAVGSVTGKILNLDSRKGDTFGIIDDVSGRYVKAYVKGDLLTTVLKLYKERVSASGIITYRPDGTISSIEARSVSKLPQSLPKLTSFLGLMEA